MPRPGLARRRQPIPQQCGRAKAAVLRGVGRQFGQRLRRAAGRHLHPTQQAVHAAGHQGYRLQILIQQPQPELVFARRHPGREAQLMVIAQQGIGRPIRRREAPPQQLIRLRPHLPRLIHQPQREGVITRPGIRPALHIKYRPGSRPGRERIGQRHPLHRQRRAIGQV